ncbi:hypothetical protein [Shewanella sp.]|jgi:hypothetical protein|uniref:hypothetical protein n=1 Tax=Shewanella sp. TaxID=50422 RepID=UPI0035684CAA
MNEVDVVTEETMPTIVPQGEIVSLEKSIENAEKYVSLMGKLRLMAIRLLNKNDVSNQGGKPYIEKSGCDKIAAAFGVQLYDVEISRENITDDKGEYYLYTCSGKGQWNNHRESEIGTCTSRDDFFGTFNYSGEKKFKPISEVDVCDVKKKAFTNFANRIIKKLIGLSFTWEELSDLSGGTITHDGVQSVSFGKGSKGGNTDSPETKKLRDECRAMLLKLNDGEAEAAKQMLVAETAFKGKDGNEIAGKDHISKLSEKQVGFLHKKLKKKVDEFEKELNEMEA